VVASSRAGHRGIAPSKNQRWQRGDRNRIGPETYFFLGGANRLVRGQSQARPWDPTKLASSDEGRRPTPKGMVRVRTMGRQTEDGHARLQSASWGNWKEPPTFTCGLPATRPVRAWVLKGFR